MPIAPTSQKQYINTYLSLVKKAKSENLDKIFEYIKTADVKTATKLSYLNSIISLKKFDPELVKGDLTKIADLRDKLGIELEKSKTADNTSDKQKKALMIINLDKLKTFVEKLKGEADKSLEDLETYILIALMVEYPLRNDLQEIFLTQHKKDLEKKVNFLYIPPKGDAILKLNQYKTSRTHGPITIEIKSELTDAIRKLIKTDDRKYLFINQSGEPLSSSNFTHRLNRIFKKEFGIPISSTLIRKIYLTSKYGKQTQDQKTDAQIFGHSLSTQQGTYIANNPTVILAQGEPIVTKPVIQQRIRGTGKFSYIFIDI